MFFLFWKSSRNDVVAYAAAYAIGMLFPRLGELLFPARQLGGGRAGEGGSRAREGGGCAGEGDGRARKGGGRVGGRQRPRGGRGRPRGGRGHP